MRRGTTAIMSTEEEKMKKTRGQEEGRAREIGGERKREGGGEDKD